MTSKTLALTVAVLVASHVSAFSAEPAIGERQNFESSDHSWRLDLNPFLVLGIFKGNSPMSLASYDLENCFFCEGMEDNCEVDGIVEVSFVDLPDEPILAVACHVGAHSQRFQIFAPWRNDTDAVFSVTGAYFVSYEIRSADIFVEYDARGENGNFETLIGIWP